MICRIAGKLASVHDGVIVVDVGGVCYELHVPAASLNDLRPLTGTEIVLHTIQFLEGNPAFGNLTPRMLGFVAESDRDFFMEFVKVKNVGMRKALRAMIVPAAQIAAAIEHGDERSLSALPEIGKRTAAQAVLQLRGKMARFASASPVCTPVSELTDAQRLAHEMLVKWGDRPVDAQRWITRAVEENPKLKEPDEIVRAAYRVKQGVS